MMKFYRSKTAHLIQIHGLYFHYEDGFAAQILAISVDSMARVTRRVVYWHFVSTDESGNQLVKVFPEGSIQ